MMELSSIQIAFVALLVTAGGVQWALFKMVRDAGDALRPVIEERDKAIRQLIAEMDRSLRAEVDKQTAIASKSRHDMANMLQGSLGKLEMDVKRLDRESVNRDDMKSSESRTTALLGKVENKLDLIMERMAGLPALEKRVEHIDGRLADAIRRLENSQPPARP